MAIELLVETAPSKFAHASTVTIKDKITGLFLLRLDEVPNHLVEYSCRIYAAGRARGEDYIITSDTGYKWSDVRE